ncbi:phosphodiester glycosidase family protein [Adhaeribacter aquaticus]|uniref:phosphodiester glycosidase family protein n=1 Tax=Adhaeribacter aquaticus TaxID=299567 RepID=UPI0006858FBF|nr:phosphodiester glycosidase family protein [Adhaeribacter aquaticus]
MKAKPNWVIVGSLFCFSTLLLGAMEISSPNETELNLDQSNFYEQETSDEFESILNTYQELQKRSEVIDQEILAINADIWPLTTLLRDEQPVGKLKREIKGSKRSNLIHTVRSDQRKPSSLPVKALLEEKQNEKKSLLENKAQVDSLTRNQLTKLQESALHAEGSKSIDFKGNTFLVFIADLEKDEIKLHLKRPGGSNFYSLGAVKEYLESKSLTPLMITNAGMFTPTYEPVGVYIEEKSLLYPLDTNPGRRDANFYLKPNGVFVLDGKNKPLILDTEAYRTALRNKTLQPKLATQSGPMLIKGGVMHNAFLEGSKSLYIRSGVGILSEKKVMFVITKQPINFYDFALFFKEIFNCKNALFLDGAISKMYLWDKSPDELGGEFGPIISVSRKM